MAIIHNLNHLPYYQDKMRISHKYKFIFFANPKTGSESVRKLLDPYSDIRSTVYSHITKENPFYSHITPKEVRDIFVAFGWDFDSYYRFVFVRNPWARLVSLYEMTFHNKRTNPDFNEWIYQIQSYGKGGGGKDFERWRQYGSYSIDNYVMDESRNILVNRIVKIENIDSDLVPILKEIGIPNIDNITIPHINRGDRRSHYTSYYVSATLKRVEEMYQYEIKEFGYSFGD